MGWYLGERPLGLLTAVRFRVTLLAMAAYESAGLNFPRRKTRPVMVGDIQIGGEAPIVVQSMTDTDTRDVDATVDQIRRLQDVGCEIVRVAVPDQDAASALVAIREQVHIPLIADIHFDHRLALASLAAGVEGLRINPGNIGSRDRIVRVVKEAKSRGIPIRIGVNSGSLENDLLQRYGGATAEAMVESALRHIRILEDLDYFAVKISLKASDIPRTVRAYRLLADKVDYPFHAGITEAGSLVSGSVKSAAGLTLLLAQGLVDTFRVSLTAPPEEEVRVAYLILSGLKIRQRGPEIISCPVCGRCEVDISRIAAEVEQRLAPLTAPLRVAIMGCMVNGPGEAKEADIGLACGRGGAVLFKQGKILKKVKEEKIVTVLVDEVMRLARSHE